MRKGLGYKFAAECVDPYSCVCREVRFCIGDLIPITNMLIHKITLLPHSSLNLAMEFGGNTGEHDLTERMKEKFKLSKKPHSYSIFSIINPTVKVAT